MTKFFEYKSPSPRARTKFINFKYIQKVLTVPHYSIFTNIFVDFPYKKKCSSYLEVDMPIKHIAASQQLYRRSKTLYSCIWTTIYLLAF